MYETLDYDKTVGLLRMYFKGKLGYTEVPTQSRLSILAACEDPKTISTFNFDGTDYPLPQTGQMWLEYELLKNPNLKGVYCISTSYRNEPNPIEGRHQKIFPMFEFEQHGNVSDLKDLEEDLLNFLGFKNDYPNDFKHTTYDIMCNSYITDILESEHEEFMAHDVGDVVFLSKFPKRTHPFWNMKQDDDDKNLFNKIDVILHGQETIGSAERSTSPDEMLTNFLNQTDGQYSQLLFDKFGKGRVMTELKEFLSHDFFPRFGGGIGVNRMARALKLEGIIK
jgi:aspartyl/asparaginyl-tRNA synthetase